MKSGLHLAAVKNRQVHNLPQCANNGRLQRSKGRARVANVPHALSHRELLATDPRGETATSIALKYGFHDLGRFAAYYREAFGETPSETLRR